MTDVARRSSLQRPTVFQWVLLACIIVLATVLRFVFISANEAHFDEIWYAQLSTGRGESHTDLPLNTLVPDVPDLTSLEGAPPFHEIYTHMNGHTHPPLHAILLRLWREVFGESITVGRSMSAVLSILCVLLIFDTARQLHPVSIALWAALLMALSAAQIEAAQETRQYPLLILMTLCAADALLRIERAGPGRWRIAGLFTSVVGMLFSHYFSVLVAAAMGLYALIHLRGASRKAAVGAMIAGGLFFVATWGPMLPGQRGAFDATMTQGAHLDDRADHITATFGRLGMAPLQLLFEPRRDNFAIAMLSAAIFILPWLRLKKAPDLLLWGLWLSIAMAVPAGLDLARGTRHLTLVRHTIQATPAMCMIIVLLMRGTRPLLEHGVPAMVAVACAIALFGKTYQRDTMPRLSEIGRYLSEARPTDEPMIFYGAAPQTWRAQWLLLATSHYSRAFPRTVAVLDRPADQPLADALKQRGSAWLVWFDFNLQPQQILPGCEVMLTRSEPFVARVAHVQWNPAP